MDEDTIKIYSSECGKPELTKDFLEHHGVNGQKWGVQNGPPYPLDSKISTGSRLKKSDGKGLIAKYKAKKIKKKRVETLKKARQVKAEKLAKQKQNIKSKEDIIKSKDIESMLKNVDLFSNKEIEDLLNRLSTESKLKEAVSKQREANKTPGQRFKESFTYNVKSGIKSGAEKTTRLVAKNLVGITAKNLANSLANIPKEGTDAERRAKFIKELFKEEKK